MAKRKKKSQASGDKIYEATFWESSELLGLLVENAPDFIMVVDRKGVIQYINRVVPGLNREEVIGKSVYDFVEKEYHALHKKTVNKVFKTGEPGVYQSEAAGPEGSRAWYENRVGPILQDGKVKAVSLVGMDITEREEVQRERNLLFEHSIDIFCITGFDGKFLQVNPAWEATLGWTPEETLGKTYLDFIHPEDIEATQSIIQKHREAGKLVFQFRNRYRHKDGSYRWLSWNTNPRPDLNISFSVVRDVTEKVEVEQALQKSEERYGTFMENFQGIAYQSRVEDINTFNILAYEGQVEEITGFPKQDFLDRKVELGMIIHPEDLPMVLEEGEKLISKPDYVADNEYRILRKGKELRWVREISQVATLGEDRLLQGAIYDITERKQAEEALNLFTKMVEQSTDSIIYTDTEFRITYINAAAEELYGWSLEEVKGKTPDIFNAEPLSDEIQQEIYETVSSKKPYVGESLNVRKDGSTFTCYMEIAAILNDDGNIIGYMGSQGDVTERVRSVEALRESEARYRDLVEEAGIAVLIDNPEGDFQYANEASVKVFGYSSEEIKNQSIESLVHPDDVDRVMKYHTDRYKGKKSPSRYEFKSIHKDGSTRQVEIAVTEIIKDGQVTGNRSYFWDITERKQAEQALRESEARYRALFEHTNDGIAFVNLDGVISAINQRLIDLLGYPEEEIVGRPTSDFVAEGEAPDAKNRIKTLIVGEDVPVYERIIRCKDGAEFTAEISLSLIRDSEGNPFYIQSAIRDISERVAAQEALRESEERYRLIFESAQEGMFIIDMEGNYLDVNPSGCAMFGYIQEEMLGADITLLMFEEDQTEEALSRSRQAWEHGSEPRVARLRKKDNAEIWVEMAIQPFVVNQERRVLGTVRDITESKRAELALQESEERYRRLVELSPVSIAVHAEGIALYVNQACMDLVGAKHEDEILGKSILSFVHPDYKELVIERMKKIGGDRELGELLEEKFVRLDGEVIDVEVTGIPITYEGKPATQVVFWDLTERKKTEEALRESERQYRTTIHGLGDMIHVVDKDLRFILVNASAMQQIEALGLDTDLIGRPLLEAFPMLSVQVMDEYSQVIETGETLITQESTKFGGQEFFTETRKIPLLEGGQVSRIITVIRDTTDRVKAEQTRQETEARFRTLSAATFEGIGISERGICIDANQQLADILGYKLDELVGMQVSEWVAPEDREQVLKNMLEGREDFYQHRALRKDGSIIDVEIRPRMMEVKGQSLRVTAILDITERVRSENLQNAVYDIARAADSSQNLDDLYAAIHKIIGEVMPAENFYIALYDEEEDILSFPYYHDSVDPPPPPEKLSRGLTAYVLRTGESLLCTEGIHEKLERQGEAELLGSPSPIWLGVPLMVEGKAIGVMTVQHYTNPDAYSEQDQQVLEFVSTQVAMTLERKQAEEALQKSNSRLQSVMDASNIGVWDTDFSEDDFYLSPSWKNQIGLDEDAEVDQVATWESRLHPEDKERVLRGWDEYLEGERPDYNIEFRLRHEDGSYRWIFSQGEAFFDKEGNLARALGCHVDISNVKQAEQDLRESEERYRNLFDNATDAIFVHDMMGQFLDVNRVACERLGYSKDELLQLSPMDIDDPEYAKKIPERTEELLEKGYLTVEGAQVRKDGHIVPIDMTSRLIEYDGKQVILTSARDITERKQAEEALRDRTHMLDERVKELNCLYGISKLIEASGGSLETIFQGTIALIPPAWQFPDITCVRITHEGKEYTSQDFKETKWSQTCDIHVFGEIAGAIDVHYLEEMSESDEGSFLFEERDLLEAVAEQIGRVVEGVRADQALHEYSVRLEDMVEERTQKLGDIQEQMVRQEKLATLGQLAGGVSHQMRAPLSGISNAVYYLQAVLPEASEDVKEYLALISDEVKDSNKIISDLLDFARIQPTSREQVPVSDLLGRVMGKTPPPDNVDIETDIDEGLPALFIDRHQLSQVIENLVTNAYQAMPKGGTLSVSAESVEDKVKITVRDTGVGISEKNIAKIFEPLFTTKARGIGLGLALSRDLVEANGGRIEVESEEGVGTSFTVTLPTIGEAA